MHRGIRIFLAFGMLLTTLPATSPQVLARDGDQVPSSSIEARLPPAGDWQTVTHDQLGFKIDYPASVFRPATKQQSEAGYILVSHDGSAKLLIAAFDNDEHTSLRDYRAHVLETSYAGADIDYAPVRRSWFVLSGTRNETEFYERVSFTCSGRRITSWAMLYPHAQQNYYNPILELIARTFRPSRPADSGC